MKVRWKVGDRIVCDGREFIVVGVSTQQAALVAEHRAVDQKGYGYIITAIMPTEVQYSIVPAFVSDEDVRKGEVPFNPLLVIEEGAHLDNFTLKAESNAQGTPPERSLDTRATVSEEVEGAD